MNRRYLEVTYRKGRPLAAYLYLPRRGDDRAATTESVGSDFNVDFAADGRPIGVEIMAPQTATLAALNIVLQRLATTPLEPADLAPLSGA
jgi:hypothetical protein